MLLYATTPSERASKGQGGNKFIRINLLAGSATSQYDMGVIEMIYTQLNGKFNEADLAEVRYYQPDITGYKRNYSVIFEKNIPKGNKKKDEVYFGDDDETNNPAHPAFGID